MLFIPGEQVSVREQIVKSALDIAGKGIEKTIEFAASGKASASIYMGAAAEMTLMGVAFAHAAATNDTEGIRTLTGPEMTIQQLRLMSTMAYAAGIGMTGIALAAVKSVGTSEAK